MKPTFMRSPAALREWFEAHQETAAEVWVGFYKRHTGEPSVTWPEAVDEALCVGWIDGIRKSIDERRYMIRFTPRRAGSIWSTINTKRAAALIADGRMRPRGLAAFAARDAKRASLYSYENRPRQLAEAYAAALRKDRAAWAFFQAQPPWYQRTASWWVMAAKKEETRQRRLATLIADSAAGRRVGAVDLSGRRGKGQESAARGQTYGGQKSETRGQKKRARSESAKSIARASPRKRRAKSQ